MIAGVVRGAVPVPGHHGNDAGNEILRWGCCLLLVLLAHATVAASTLDWSRPVPPVELPPPAIMIDLGPAQPPPPPPPQQAMIEPPRPVPPAAPAPEVPKIEVPEVKSEVALEQRKPAKPKAEQKKKRKEKPKPAEKPPLPPLPQPLAQAPEPPSLAPAKPVEQGPIQASTSAAKAQESSASAASAAAMKNWESLVAAHLVKHKRSPRMRHRQPMTVYIHVAIDRQGQILSRNVVQSSGDERLDEAALDLIDRANPLPPPPADYAEARLQSINLPVVFTPK